jgi:hypothetical protein
MGQHYTDATDTRALAFVISAINDVIIQGQLDNSIINRVNELTYQSIYVIVVFYRISPVLLFRGMVLQQSPNLSQSSKTSPSLLVWS